MSVSKFLRVPPGNNPLSTVWKSLVQTTRKPISELSKYDERAGRPSHQRNGWPPHYLKAITTQQSYFEVELEVPG